MADALRRVHEELVHELTEKRLRATVGGDTVVDSTRAVLVWEPRRIGPAFAVPADDIRAELSPTAAPAPAGDPPPVLHPGIPFRVHSTAGTELDVRAGGTVRVAAAFRPGRSRPRGLRPAGLRRVRRLVRGGRGDPRPSP